ncbi:MAG: hypothetical protein H8E44_00945 [Planctomycetes bacterium]|nr:hypothetical protein [Planctomycetota bacterium]
MIRLVDAEIEAEANSPDTKCPARPGVADRALGSRIAVISKVAETEDIAIADRIPEILKRDGFSEYLNAFMQEYQPVGPTEHVVVRDLARQSVSMDVWSEAIGAISRQDARELPKLALCDEDEAGLVLTDSILAASMSQENIDRGERHLRFHSRAFYRALSRLENLQDRRKKSDVGGPTIPANPFTSELACEKYLADRYRTGEWRCSQCGATEGHHIASRRCWECAGCGCQTGLRQGTVMADSPIPLTRWFNAIWLILGRPRVSTTELVSTLGITRIMTVRNMANKIRAAMNAEDASDLLAGLDNYYTMSQVVLPESSALHPKNPTVEESCSQ